MLLHTWVTISAISLVIPVQLSNCIGVLLFLIVLYWTK